MSRDETQEILKDLKVDNYSVFNSYYAFDLESSDLYVLNKKKNKIRQVMKTGSKVYCHLYDSVVAYGKRESWLDLMKYRSFRVTKTYNPCFGLIMSGPNDTLLLNTYQVPTYYGSKRPPQPLTRYHKFMEHLFPSLESRTAVERWMWQSILGKAKTHLLLVGAKGTGKTFLAATIMEALHGDTNHFVESATSLKSNFDSYDSTKTLIFLDEATFQTDELKSKIKLRLNTKASFNHKYQKINSKTQRCHASLIIAANEASSLLVEVDDRCFTIPDLTNTPARLDPAHLKNIDELAKLLDPDRDLSDAFIKSINDYLRSKYNSDDPDHVETEIHINSDNFKNMVIKSDTPYRKVVYDTAMSQETFMVDDVKQRLKALGDRKLFESYIDKNFIIQLSATFESRFNQKICTYDTESGMFDSHMCESLL
jgi:tRNA A37 threonylcarbamoyladenosine biosynthesis protein TsaE